VASSRVIISLALAVGVDHGGSVALQLPPRELIIDLNRPQSYIGRVVDVVEITCIVVYPVVAHIVVLYVSRVLDCLVGGVGPPSIIILCQVAQLAAVASAADRAAVPLSDAERPLRMLRSVSVSDKREVLPVMLILREWGRAILRECVFEIVLLQAVERISFP